MMTIEERLDDEINCAEEKNLQIGKLELNLKKRIKRIAKEIKK